LLPKPQNPTFHRVNLKEKICQYGRSIKETTRAISIITN